MPAIRDPAGFLAGRVVRRSHSEIENLVEPAHAKMMRPDRGAHVGAIELVIRARQDDHFIVEAVADPDATGRSDAQRKDTVGETGDPDASFATARIDLDDRRALVEKNRRPYRAAVRGDGEGGG